MASYGVEPAGDDLWQVVDWDTKRPVKDFQPTSYDEACSMASVLEFEQGDLLAKFAGAWKIEM